MGTSSFIEGNLPHHHEQMEPPRGDRDVGRGQGTRLPPVSVLGAQRDNGTPGSGHAPPSASPQPHAAAPAPSIAHGQGHGALRDTERTLAGDAGTAGPEHPGRFPLGAHVTGGPER